MAMPTGGAAASPLASLTPREREVAALVARGCSNRQIAQELVISESTATLHVKNILGKLGFRSRSQIAALAVAEGLLVVEAANGGHGGAVELPPVAARRPSSRGLLVVLALALLGLAAATQPVHDLPAGAHVLAEDDFSDPSRGLFNDHVAQTVTPLLPNSGSAAYQASYAYENGALVAHVSGRYPAGVEGVPLGIPGFTVFPGMVNLTPDFGVEVEASAVKSPAQAALGVFYAIQNQSVYNWEVMPGQGRYVVGIGDLSNRAPDQWRPGRVPAGGRVGLDGARRPVTLRLEVRGQELAGWVNGKLLARTREDGLVQRPGGIGLFAAMIGQPQEDEVQIRFEKLRIYSLPS